MDVMQCIYETIVNLKINEYLLHTTYLRTCNTQPLSANVATTCIEAIPFTLADAIPLALMTSLAFT